VVKIRLACDLPRMSLSGQREQPNADPSRVIAIEAFEASLGPRNDATPGSKLSETICALTSSGHCR
jgi:hypothetical protein